MKPEEGSARTAVAVDLILVPYDSGRRGERMGAGPESLRAVVEAYARATGRDVLLRTLECRLAYPAEAAAAFDLCAQLAPAVREAIAAGRFPLILTGNCVSAAGVVAGLPPDTTGLVWFDAHADFNTPETSRSAFLDGMAVSIVNGRSWSAAALAVPGFRAVPECFTALVGTRDIDPEEKRLLASSSVTVVNPQALRAGGLDAALAHIARHVSSVYVHVDLDVLDADDVGRANPYAARGGISVAELCRAVEQIQERFTVIAATLSAYDPAADADGRVRAAVPAILNALLPRAPHAAAPLPL